MARLEAISLDMGGAYKSATDAKAPHVTQCVDPFHLVKLANEAVDKAGGGPGTRSASSARTRPVNAAGPALTRPSCVATRPDGSSTPAGRCSRSPTTSSPLSSTSSTSCAGRVRSCIAVGSSRKGSVISTACRVPLDAAYHLDWWLAWACRCRIPAFVTLSKTVRNNRERILAAIELGLSNSKLEGLNSKIRLINHRGYGHHSAAALIAMIYLCCGDITVELPTQRVLPASN